MSIYDEITYWGKQARLFQVQSSLDEPTKRHLYVSPEIQVLLDGPWSTAAWEGRCGYLRADLDRFVEGQSLDIAELPYKGKWSYMLRLHPPSHEVWEIRSRIPKPGLRLFGAFAGFDNFVALTWASRAELGGPESRAWRDAIVACRTEWNNLFPAYRPLSGANFHDYLSKIILV